MTVTTDLARRHATKTRLYLKIDGLRQQLWQDDETETLPGWVESGYVCLHPPKEVSTDINPAQMEASLSVMTFELQDVEDTDGNSFFGKEFAVARFDDQDHWRINVGATPRVFIDADGSDIPLKDATGITQGFNGFIGLHAINSHNVTAAPTGNVINGVTIGIHSAIPATINSVYGATIARPENTAAVPPQHVGTVPFTYHGKRVALYLSTFDDATQTWNSTTTLMWSGRISNTIQFDPKKNIWKLSCESIFADLKRKICTNMAATSIHGINLFAKARPAFQIKVYYNSSLVSHQNISVNNQWYKNAWDLAKRAYFSFDVASNRICGKFTKKGKDTFMIDIFAWSGTSTGGYRIEVVPSARHTGVRCMILPALGFTSAKSYTVTLEEDSNDSKFWRGTIDADEKPAVDFHPMNEIHNNNRLHVRDVSRFWANQGDDSVDAAYCMAKVKDEGAGGSDFRYIARYTSKTEKTSSYNSDYFTINNNISTNSIYQSLSYSSYAYIVAREGDARQYVKQIYSPVYIKTSYATVGPYEALLRNLLSTGTSGYNDATYDVLPYELGTGMQADLVDQQSFLDADKEISMNPMNTRGVYVIDKPISFLELIKREALLYGYTVVWNRGKLRVRDIVYPSPQNKDETIDESVLADRSVKPMTDMPTSTVVNQYELHIQYYPFTGKYEPPITVSDSDSVAMFGAKKITIKHPGIVLGDTDVIVGAVSSLLLARPLRFPSPIVKVPLAPQMMNRVYPGDLVTFVSSHVPDSVGGGTFSISTTALVLGVRWKYQVKSDKQTGSATLQLLNRYRTYGTPWTPSAAVVSAAADLPE